MPYDTKEAETIFANAHVQLDPTSHYKARESAAHGLLDAVEQAAKAAGYRLSTPSHGVRMIVHQHHGVVNAVVDDDRFYLHVEGPPQKVIKDLAIEYNGKTKTFVGKEEDTFILPISGEPPKRRSAVAVVAERIVALIAEQSAAKRQVR